MRSMIGAHFLFVIKNKEVYKSATAANQLIRRYIQMIFYIVLTIAFMLLVIFLFDTYPIPALIISLLYVAFCIVSAIIKSVREKKFDKIEQEFLQNHNAFGNEYFKSKNNSHRVIVSNNALYARTKENALGSLWSKNDIESISMTIEHGNKIVDYTDEWAGVKAGIQDGLLNALGISTIRDMSDFTDKKVNEETITATIHLITRVNGKTENLKGYAIYNQPISYESTAKKLEETIRFVDAVNDMLDSDQYNSAVSQSVIQQDTSKKEPPKLSKETTAILNKVFLGTTIVGAIGVAIILGVIFVGLIVYGRIYLYNGYAFTRILVKISTILMIIGFGSITTKLVLCYKFNMELMPKTTTKTVLLIILDVACLLLTIYTMF